MSDCNIVIAEDYPIFRMGLIKLIEVTTNWNVIGEAVNGVELLSLLRKVVPDIAIVDLAMPRMQGIDVLEEISRSFPQVRTVVLSGYLHEDNITRAVAAGASGLVCKTELGQALISAIDIVRMGGTYISQNLQGVDKKTFQDFMVPNKNTATPTQREIEIITCLSGGLTSKEIGKKLNVSPRTIENHRNNIMKKLGVRNTVELLRYAFRCGYASFL